MSVCNKNKFKKRPPVRDLLIEMGCGIHDVVKFDKSSAYLKYMFAQFINFHVSMLENLTQ